MGKPDKPTKEKLDKIKGKLKKVPKSILNKMTVDKSNIENADVLRIWMKEIKKK